MKKYYFTYQTKNLLNGKTYVGVHKTNNLDDGYVGSGIHLRRAIEKNGVENFVSMPLCFFDTEQEAYDEEIWLVDQKWVDSKDNYNLALGGKGGFRGVRSAEHCKNLSRAKRGVPNPKQSLRLKGRTPYNAIPVLDTETGIFYTPSEFRSTFPEYNWNTMRARLSGQKINNTKFTR